MGKVLFVEHEPRVPGGLAQEWARAAGLSPSRFPARDQLPFPDPGGFDAVVVLGSSASVYDQTMPWIAPELAFVREALTVGVPVLGICFGGQLLATALGGTVRPAPDGGEVGWIQVDTDHRSLVDPGPWLAFHFDVFTVPPGAAELARTPVGPQAFRSGPHLGLQFHPEVDRAILTEWARDDRGRLARLGIDPARLRNDRAGWAAARANAMRLFETWWAAARQAPSPLVADRR